MPPSSSRPVITGPQIVPTWNSTVLNEIAPDSRSLGTRFGVMAWPAGAQKARATPNKAAIAKMTLGLFRR